MKPEGLLRTSYNESGNYIARVKLAHDEDFYSIVDAARRDYPLPILEKRSDDEVIIFAEREQDSTWHLRLQVVNESFTRLENLYVRQFLSETESEKLENAVSEKYRDKFTNIFNIENQRNTILEIMEDIMDTTHEGYSESMSFNDYNGYPRVFVTYYGDDDAFSVEAEKEGAYVQVSGLNFDELEEVLVSIGDEKSVQKGNKAKNERV